MFADGFRKLTAYSQNLGGLAEHLTAKEQRDAEEAYQRQLDDRERRKDEGKRQAEEARTEWEDIYGEGGGDKPKVKAAFVWHIMYAVFALMAVMLVGYLSKMNMAKKDSDAEDDIPMGAVKNKVPKPIAPAQGPGPKGRDMDEERYRLLARMIGSMESKPAPITFQINAAGATGQQQEALKTLAELNIKPKPTARPQRNNTAPIPGRKPPTTKPPPTTAPGRTKPPPTAPGGRKKPTTTTKPPSTALLGAPPIKP